MTDKLITDVLSKEQIRLAFQQVLQIGERESDNRTIRVLFGFAWGNEYNDWNEITIAWSDVNELVKKVEGENYGSIGSDDFFLYIEDDEIQFCHESDIHFPNNPKGIVSTMICNFLKTLPPNKALKGTPLRGAP